jgi:hypothetical protein
MTMSPREAGSTLDCSSTALSTAARRSSVVVFLKAWDGGGWGGGGGRVVEVWRERRE